ncbi:unnamed protein product [Ceutorhynchus assimilis]|uniref:Splicing factor 3B subunit 1 n=1 Tax=Ceutorhynchus assimilis TaxID=467358 RepID=A0A9N9N0J8_9CUCU|nr:unnamed protein product [Ceutorhynchus assimilis]
MDIPQTQEDIDVQIKEMQRKRQKLISESNNNGVRLGETGIFDREIYSRNDEKYEGYVSSIPTHNDSDNDEDEEEFRYAKEPGQAYAVLFNINTPKNELDVLADRKRPTIADREDEYKENRRKRIISPERVDPFADNGKTPEANARGFMQIMKETLLQSKEIELKKHIKEKADKRTLTIIENVDLKLVPKKKGRWDQTLKPESDLNDTPICKNWNQTPVHQGTETPGLTPSQSTRMWELTPDVTTPGHGASILSKKSGWDNTLKAEEDAYGWVATPRTQSDRIQETPDSSKRRSRWDQTPSIVGTPLVAASVVSTPSRTPYETPVHKIPVLTRGGSTPIGIKAKSMTTPSPAFMTPEQLHDFRWMQEIDKRNGAYSDEELDCLFPQGYKILPPPVGYAPVINVGRKLTATPTPLVGQSQLGFFMQSSDKFIQYADDQPKEENLPFMKPEDAQYFSKLLVDVDETSLGPEEEKERIIMKLLLKIKNGTPPMRKSALRQITAKAREFGAAALFNQILPLLMSPVMEDQERHFLVKVIDRILYKLDDLIRPYVHKILVVIEPLLIDEDYFSRIEGREIISNVAKAAGLATMISTMRPDIDNIDEYVRNTTARAFAVVASALGVPSMLPFLKAVCKSKKSWQARHTGIKIVQQIAILIGCAVLPHLKALVSIIEHGLLDEQQKVRTITALGIAALAEAATPYGIESFDSTLKPLWRGIRVHRGKGLAAFLKAIGYLVPLMDAEYANYYIKEVMLILIREFLSPDEEMKKIVLKVVMQCCSTNGVEAEYIKKEILPLFFKSFWTRRMAMDRRNYKHVVDTTIEIANIVGAPEILHRIVDDLKDEHENYRQMVMETIDKIIGNVGTADIDSRLEEQLIDGLLYAFQEQTTEDFAILDGFGRIVNNLGKRVKAYLPQICGTILWRLNNRSAKVRQQAADLISKIAIVIKTCQNEKLLAHLGIVLYEYLGEEYPETLGSILGGLKAIVSVIGMTNMNPPIKDLLPRLTPILKNRHEKVQENCIDLVGRIADRGTEYVSAREWMRVCFELLELLKAQKKAIRRAAVNTFGYIAKGIGPHDVLATLLNNLKVQERQNRVCTTVAIAIVAETCSPFTVLPALLNEYRVPELNVQNGVLKSLSFLFEYIGEMAKDYIYAVVPLLEDALMDRDIVHRQTACAAIKHIALGVYGLDCEDVLVHLLNYVWPNVFETSPHLIRAFMEAIEGLRVSLGPIKLLQYTLQGLFHPSRKVRCVYWKIYNSLYIGGQDALVAGYPRVSDDNKNQYAPWAEVCRRDHIENTPLSPHMDPLLLQNKHLNLDGSKLKNLGFTLTVPRPTVEKLKEIIDDYVKMKVFPVSLAS